MGTEWQESLSCCFADVCSDCHLAVAVGYKILSEVGIPCFWNHSGIWNLSYSTGLTSFWRDRCLRSGRRTPRSCRFLSREKGVRLLPKIIGLGHGLSNGYFTCSSWGCPAENGMHGIPFKGCNKKLKGLLSTMTIRHKSFDMQVRSLTCSLYSLIHETRYCQDTVNLCLEIQTTQAREKKSYIMWENLKAFYEMERAMWYRLPSIGYCAEVCLHKHRD